MAVICVVFSLFTIFMHYALVHCYMKSVIVL